MGYSLERVLNGMGKVVHGEDTPLRALTVVLDISDAVEHGIAHVEVAGGKVDLCAQRVFSLGKFAVFHALEQVEVFLNRSVSVRAYGRLARIAAIFLKLLGRELTDISKPFFYKLKSILIGLFKVIRAVEKAVTPVKAKPVDILLDGIDILGVLLGRICVVHAQVADAAVFLGCAEIYDKRLAVADVQISVRFGRKTGVHLHSGESAALGKVLVDKVFNKILAYLFHGCTPVILDKEIINDI